MDTLLNDTYKKVILFHLFLNILFALFITLSSYYHVPLSSFEGKFMYFIHLCIVQFSFAGVLYFLSLFKVVFKFVFSLLFITLGIISFWTYSINISTSTTLVNAVLTTKPYIIKDLITFQFVLYIIVLSAVLFFILKHYNTIEPLKGVKLFLPLSCMLFLMFFLADKKRGHSFRSKLPYSLFYSIKEHFNTEELPLKETLQIPNNINTNKVNIVFVIGESLRADHLGLNGYERKTTPLLSKRDNLISFSSIFTNKTNTASSLPCILTDKSIYSSEKDSIRSIFSVFKALNIPTHWIGNQLLESTFKSIVETNNDVIIIDKLKSYWNIGKKQDLKLLNEFDTHFNENNYGLYTLHMIGSHWWYEDKYTDEYRKYKPIIDGKYIPSLSKEQIVNSYDNTILYLDNFLNELILRLENNNQPTVLIYIADHGESLGENGRWLHSHTEALTKPGMIVWYSDVFKEAYPDKVDALFTKQNSKLNTDIIFHSLLDIIDVEQMKYDKKQSIFSTLK